MPGKIVQGKICVIEITIQRHQPSIVIGALYDHGLDPGMPLQHHCDPSGIFAVWSTGRGIHIAVVGAGSAVDLGIEIVLPEKPIPTIAPIAVAVAVPYE